MLSKCPPTIFVPQCPPTIFLSKCPITIFLTKSPTTFLLPHVCRSKSKDRADAPRDSAASGFIKKLTGGGSGREERARSTTNLVSGREGLTTNTNLVVAPGREEQANHTAESCDREACTLTRSDRECVTV